MNECDDELVIGITPDVMRVLEGKSFFDRLDDLLSPVDSLQPASRCRGTFDLAKSILLAAGVDESDFDDIFCVLRAQGGCCDCEILYNVSETNRLKSNYWRARSEGQTPVISHALQGDAMELGDKVP